MHVELLKIASELARREAGNPKNVSLKRSVSTAYYALFHAVAAFCAKELVGSYAPWQPFCHIYRSLDHGTAIQTFQTILSSADFGSEAKEIGDAFLTLKKRRESADYDLAFRIGRKATLELIERARRAIWLLDQLSPNERKLLAARLIGRTRKT